MNEEQKKLLDGMTTKDYFIFETDETYIVTVKDWKVEFKEVSDFKDKEKTVLKEELACTFILEDGTEKKFSTLSVRFAEKIKPFIRDMKEPVKLQITKVGEKSAVGYLMKKVE